MLSTIYQNSGIWRKRGGSCYVGQCFNFGATQYVNNVLDLSYRSHTHHIPNTLDTRPWPGNNCSACSQSIVLNRCHDDDDNLTGARSVLRRRSSLIPCPPSRSNPRRPQYLRAPGPVRLSTQMSSRSATTSSNNKFTRHGIALSKRNRPECDVGHCPRRAWTMDKTWTRTISRRTAATTTTNSPTQSCTSRGVPLTTRTWSWPTNRHTPRTCTRTWWCRRRTADTRSTERPANTPCSSLQPSTSDTSEYQNGINGPGIIYYTVMSWEDMLSK